MPKKRMTRKPPVLVERLREVVKRKFGTRAEMERQCGLQHNTVTNWFRVPPRTPDIQHLGKVASVGEVSLDWLVLGRGRMEWPLVGRVQLLGAIREELMDRVASRYQSDRERPGRALGLLLTPEWAESDQDKLWKELVQYGVQFLEDVAADHDEEDAAGDEDWSSHPPPK